MDSDHFLVIGKSTGEVIYHKCCLMVAFCRKNCLTQGGNMDEQEKKYQDLFTELTNYERGGVRIRIFTQYIDIIVTFPLTDDPSCDQIQV